MILVIASFMVFNDLENAGNMASLLQMLAASMDMANSIDDTPVMDEKGADVVSASSEIIFDNVDFSYADRKILVMSALRSLTERPLLLSARPVLARRLCAT